MINYSKVKFLVVDDEEMVRQVIRDYLKSFGFHDVEEAFHGLSAWERLQKGGIDFVLSDWDMPMMNGLDLLRAMRGDPKYVDIAFIMITAPISHENLKIEEAAKAEVDAYIIKPYRASTLKEKVGEVLFERALQARRGVLIVDDHEMVRANLKEMLTQAGYGPIFEADDGDQAFRVLSENVSEIAIMICDWEMPKVTGLELLRKVRIDKELSQTPFIMITSQTSIEHLKLQKAIEADVDHYLIKPFTSETLTAKMSEVLDESKRERSVKMKLNRALASIMEGDYRNARRLFKQVLFIDPKNVDAQLGLARIKVIESPTLGFEEAMTMIKRVVAAHPKLDRGYIDMAFTFEKQLSLERATQCILQGIQVCPASEKLHYHLGRLLIESGKREKGVEELVKAIELKADFPEAKELLYQAQVVIERNSGEGPKGGEGNS